jgi:uncharacterized RDD family membrane protein YckC
MNWYYADGGKQAGPIDDAELARLVGMGKVQADTLVWHEGLANWRPYGEVASSNPTSLSAAPPVLGIPSAAPPAAGEVVCVECGKIFSKENAISYGSVWVCANCKPLFVQKLRQGVAPITGGLAYVGFWVRLGAKLIDGLIIGVVVGLPTIILLLSGAFTPASGGRGLDLRPLLIQVLIQFVSQALMVTFNALFLGKFGATPGKMALGLRVVTAEGAPISWGRAWGRSAAEIISGMICDIGYIIAAFDEQKRTLHDHIASTRVIYKR